MINHQTREQRRSQSWDRETIVPKPEFFAYLLQAKSHTNRKSSLRKWDLSSLLVISSLPGCSMLEVGPLKFEEFPSFVHPGELLMMKDCKMEPHNNPPTKFKLKLHEGQVCVVHSSVIVGSLPEGSQHLRLSMWKGLKPVFIMETQQQNHTPRLYLCCHETCFSKQSSRMVRVWWESGVPWKVPSSRQVPWSSKENPPGSVLLCVNVFFAHEILRTNLWRR